MAKKFLLLFLFICSSYRVWAQMPKPLKEEIPVLMKNESYGTVTIHSEGWGIGFRRGWHVTGVLKRMIDLDLVTMKHPKEFSKASQYENGQSYVYGKINEFVILRAGIGYQKVLYGKGEKGGIQIRYNYFGGASLGFLKPIYYEVQDTINPNKQNTIKFEPSYPDYLYYSKAPVLLGFNEMQFRPGAYIKTGLSFEYGKEDTEIKALEVGACLDAFPSAVPIMALIDNKRLFLSFYISLSWGKRWI